MENAEWDRDKYRVMTEANLFLLTTKRNLQVQILPIQSTSYHCLVVVKFKTRLFGGEIGKRDIEPESGLMGITPGY